MTSFSVLSLLIVLSNLNISNTPMNEFELPQTWTKEFTITYSFNASSGKGNTELKFSYDSCHYTIQPGNRVPETGVFAMTEANRAEILKKMHELKVNTIKSEFLAAVRDGWEKSLYFGVHGIQGGAKYTMSDKHKEIFSKACDYLYGFVLMKRSKTK